MTFLIIYHGSMARPFGLGCPRIRLRVLLSVICGWRQWDDVHVFLMSQDLFSITNSFMTFNSKNCCNILAVVTLRSLLHRKQLLIKPDDFIFNLVSKVNLKTVEQERVLLVWVMLHYIRIRQMQSNWVFVRVVSFIWQSHASSLCCDHQFPFLAMTCNENNNRGHS